MEKTNRTLVLYVLGILVTLMLAAFYNPVGGEANSVRNLSLGKIGGDVRQLQIDLGKSGYKLEPHDGLFGFKTQDAVTDLQKKNHLKISGIVDDETRKVIYAEKHRSDSRSDRKPVVSRGVSRKDVITLARVVHGEARGESFEGQVAVAAVIVNRTNSGLFPKTINGVVYQPGAFDAVSDGQIWLDPDERSIKAAELALSGYDPTGEAIYYWNPAKTTNRWIWSRPIVTEIGQHVFAR